MQRMCRMHRASKKQLYICSFVLPLGSYSKTLIQKDNTMYLGRWGLSIQFVGENEVLGGLNEMRSLFCFFGGRERDGGKLAGVPACQSEGQSLHSALFKNKGMQFRL